MTEVTKTKNGRHHFKWMTFDGKKVRIDKDIVNLVGLLWKHSIRTTNSCHASCSFYCKHKYVTTKDDKYGTMMTPVRTDNCHKYVWLVFESTKDLEKLYNLAAEYGTPMYDTMSCDGALTTGSSRYKIPIDRWSYQFVMSNQGVHGHWGRPIINGKRATFECWVDDGCEKNNFVLSPQLTFPRSHIKHLEQKLQEALK